MKSTSRALLAATVVVCGACGNGIYFQDDECAEHSTSLFGHPDQLSQPWALGTQVGLTADTDNTNMADWKLVSDDPTIAAVGPADHAESGTEVSWPISALAEGATRLRLFDAQGQEQHSADVSVAAADSARLVPHGPMRMLDSAPESIDDIVVSEERVLVGGTAVLAVAYYHGKDRVYGRGLASVAPQAGLSVVPQTTQGGPATEWLELIPSVEGSYTLSLSASGRAVASLPVTAVPASAIATLSLATEQTQLKDDAQIWVLAVARDASQHVVDGVWCSWTLGGAPQADDDGKAGALGDLLRYTYESGPAAQPLTATFGALSATQSLKVKDAYVTDTTYLGCSAGAGTAPLWLGLLALGLAVRRRGALRSSR